MPRECVPSPFLVSSHAHFLPEIKTAPGFKPYLNVPFDTLKLHHTAHASKTNNLVINEHEDLILLPSRSLYDSGIRTHHSLAFHVNSYTSALGNETELSMFSWDQYATYRANPTEKRWE